MGFEPYGIDPDVLRLGDTFFDEELMVLALNRSRSTLAGGEKIARCVNRGEP